MLAVNPDERLSAAQVFKATSENGQIVEPVQQKPEFKFPS